MTNWMEKMALALATFGAVLALAAAPMEAQIKSWRVGVRGRACAGRVCGRAGARTANEVNDQSQTCRARHLCKAQPFYFAGAGRFYDPHQHGLEFVSLTSEERLSIRQFCNGLAVQSGSGEQTDPR